MGYYTGFRGDYYTGRGDFFSKAKRKLKKGFKAVSRINPALGLGLTKTNQMQGAALMSFMPGGMPTGSGSIGSTLGGFLGEKIGLPSSVGSMLGGLLTGEGSVPGDSPYIPDILEVPLESAGLNAPRGKRHRTMNAANVSALRRALRRVDSFRNLAKKSGALPAARRLPAQRLSKCCK